MYIYLTFKYSHGVILPESPRYLELVAGLRVPETCL